MKVALGQINTTVGDLPGNLDRMVRMARDAAAKGAALIAFPELALTGYPPRDLIDKPTFLDRTARQLDRLARETASLPLAVICGFTGRSDGSAGKRATNSAAVLFGGQLMVRQDKVLLPTYDVFDEARYFAPGEHPMLFAHNGLRIAVAVCEDAWNDKQYWERQLYRRDPVEEMAAAGAEMVISINASPYHMGKRALRREVFRTTATHHKMPVLYVNQVGGNDQLVFDGSSFAINPEGNVMASGMSFREDMVMVDTGKGSGDKRENFPDETEAVYEALTLGTRDYIRKCGFRRVLVGLSGGIDSSLTAAIAVDAVGVDNVIGVAMPGPFSSGHSLSDAREMAGNFGIRFEVASISPVYENFLGVLDPIFQGAARDVTEENLQARLRGVTLMAMSNKWSALVLTTGNKSELAVGYCTLYGDMCGGLAVISDVPKTLVYELARIANKRHNGAIPESVFEKAPSAELREDQKDSDSLPPYEVLDRILKSCIEDYEPPQTIAAELGLPLDFVRDIIRKVDRNEYKRQQAAPGLKVTTKAFGVGRRFPIAQRFTE